VTFPAQSASKSRLLPCEEPSSWSRPGECRPVSCLRFSELSVDLLLVSFTGVPNAREKLGMVKLVKMLGVLLLYVLLPNVLLLNALLPNVLLLNALLPNVLLLKLAGWLAYESDISHAGNRTPSVCRASGASGTASLRRLPALCSLLHRTREALYK
jgi:hypothetical protein